MKALETMCTHTATSQILLIPTYPRQKRIQQVPACRKAAQGSSLVIPLQHCPRVNITLLRIRTSERKFWTCMVIYCFCLTEFNSLTLVLKIIAFCALLSIIMSGILSLYRRPEQITEQGSLSKEMMNSQLKSIITRLGVTSSFYFHL